MGNLKDLKIKAKNLGIEFAPNITFDKLKEKVDAKLKELDETATPNEKIQQEYEDLIRKKEEDAKKPILCIVHDLDPLYQGEPTIVLNTGNSYFKVGAIIKKEVEQLIPKCLVEALKEKTMIRWVDQLHPITKRPTGNKIPITTKRFQIEILDKKDKK